MKLALPLGLLALLFIIGLVLIYILKPKYQDKKVASTHIWKLSMNYVKRKVPMQWLRSSLLFFIQLLIFAIFAFMLARPIVVLATTQGEKIVILDASASMNAQVGDKTRFERAKSEIGALADATTPEDRFTVILATDNSDFLVQRTDSSGFVKQKLSETHCTLAEANIDAAMKLAEIILDQNRNAEVHLYTDTDYRDSGRVKVHNMSSKEFNAAILDFTASRVNGKYVFVAEIASYGKATELAVSLVVDGRTQVPKFASCAKDGTTTVSWETNFTGYTSADVHLQGVTDSFPYDNDFTIYNSTAESFRVQLVSDDPGFLHSALLATKSCEVEVPDLTVEEPTIETSGFDLYVYDGVLPEVKPTDGAVWLINPPYEDYDSSEMLSTEFGISFSGKQNGEYTLSSAGGTGDTFNSIMHGVSPASVLVTEYTKVASNADYENMMLCGDDPVLFVKNDDGLKTVVLAFDIHMSDLPIRASFPMLVKNICSYTMQPTVKDTLFTVGDTARINAKPDATLVTVKATYADGRQEEKSYTSFPVDLKISAPASYTVTQVLGSGRVVTDGFYARVAKDESIFGLKQDMLVNPVVSTTGTDDSVEKDTMDIFVYLAAAMIVIVCIEWELQYHEQF